MYDSGNPYSVQQYQLPNGNVVSLTAQQYQQIFGPGPQQTPPQQQQAQQPMMQSPMTQRQTAPAHINGRVVSSHDEIAPNEIPMNGEFCYFPSSDGQTIYAKRWDSNGNIQNETFVRQMQNLPNGTNGASDAPEDEYLTRIMEQLNAIEAKIDKQRPYKKPYNKNYNHQKQVKTNNKED